MPRETSAPGRRAPHLIDLRYSIACDYAALAFQPCDASSFRLGELQSDADAAPVLLEKYRPKRLKRRLQGGDRLWFRLLKLALEALDRGFVNARQTRGP